MVSARAIKAGAAYVELTVNNSSLVRGLRRAQARLKAFGRSVGNVGRTLLKLSAIAAAPFALAGRTYAGFSDQMAEVRAVTGATGDDFEALTAQAKELGRTTSFTARQVAQGMTELGRAGYSATEILAAMPSVLDLARGTATDLGEAAGIAAATMRGFGLAASDTTRIADVLTATANNSAQTLSDIGEAMKYVAPLAMEAGETLEDTAAALGVLANNAIKGTMAGTALARAYKNLSREAARNQLAEIGVSAVDAHGNLRKVADILADIGRATRSMGSAQRLAIFESLFGRGQAAALKLASADNFQDMRNALDGVDGTARRTAETMDNTLGGSFRKFMSAVEGVQIALGEAISGTLRKWMGALTEVAGRITKIIQKNREFVVSILKVIAIAAAVGVALVAIGVAGAALSFVFGGIAGIVSGVVTVFGMLASVIGAILSPIGLVIAGVVALAVTILHATGAGSKALGWLGEKFQRLKATALAAFKGISDALAAGDLSLAARILWLTLKMEWQKGVFALKEYWVGFKEIFMRIATEAFYGTLKILAGAWDGMRALWTITVHFLSNVWTNFVTGILKVWNRASGALKKAWAKLKSAFDDDTQYQVEVQRIDAEMESDAQAIDARRKAQLDESDRQYQEDLSRIGQDYESTAAELDRQAREAHEARRRKHEAELDAARDAVGKARTEWQDALAEAARKRAEAEAEEDTDKPKSVMDDLARKLKDAGRTLTGITAKSLEVRGTFSAVAARGMGASGVAERTADATEETAKNTRRILQEMDENELAFG